MALQHRRPAAIHLVLQSLNDVWMVVPGIMHAVSGQKIQDAAAVFSKQFAAQATLILDIHTQQVKQRYPLRIDVVVIIGAGRGHLRQYRRVASGCHRFSNEMRAHLPGDAPKSLLVPKLPPKLNLSVAYLLWIPVKQSDFNPATFQPLFENSEV